jgi:hypothetical protein
LFGEHIAIAVDRQSTLNELVLSLPWKLDLGAGTLTFGGDRFRFETQVLGVETPARWAWVWTVGGPEVPSGLKRDAVALRSFGRKNDLAEFAEPTHPLCASFTGGHVASIGTSLRAADGYFGCPFRQGKLYVLIHSPLLAAARQREPMAARVVRLFPQVLSSFAVVDHRTALRKYLHADGFAVREGANALAATGPDGSRLKGFFDERERLQRIFEERPD